MNVPAGLLFGRPFHAHGATKFSFKERQRVLRRRLLPALNMFEAIGHETIVMAGHFCLSRFGGKLLRVLCYYTTNGFRGPQKVWTFVPHSYVRYNSPQFQALFGPRSTKSVDYCLLPGLAESQLEYGNSLLHDTESIFLIR